MAEDRDSGRAAHPAFGCESNRRLGPRSPRKQACSGALAHACRQHPALRDPLQHEHFFVGQLYIEQRVLPRRDHRGRTDGTHAGVPPRAARCSPSGNFHLSFSG